MTLRQRTVITVGLTFLGLVVIAYIAAQLIVLNSFAQLERQSLEDDLQRAINALNDVLVKQDVLNLDWAAWDDTYQFIQDRNETYIESNLLDQTFIDTQLNLMIFVNMDGDLVFGKQFDLDRQEALSVMPDLYETFRGHGLFDHAPMNSRRVGVLARLEKITLSANQLLRFFDNLLEEARQSRGILKLEEASFKVEVLLAESAIPLRTLAAQKGLSLHIETDPHLPPLLYGDVKRLRQIITNLTSNAIKFTAQGTVTVRLAQPDAQRWAITVADTGRGIAPEDQAHIFDAFWQVDGSMTRDTNRGVGLGLSIVKQLTTQMGGTVMVQSQPGVGSTFQVILPLRQAQAIHHEQTLNAPQ